MRNAEQGTDDRYRAGQLAMMHRAALVEIQLLGSGLMAWPIEFLFSPNGEALRA